MTYPLHRRGALTSDNSHLTSTTYSLTHSLTTSHNGGHQSSRHRRRVSPPLFTCPLLTFSPGGLVTLKTLLEASTPSRRIEARLFEAEAEIGGTFRYRSYENAELVSSKQLTSFSDFRMPPETPDHVTLPQYVAYLRAYCDEFNLWPHIKLRCRVSNIAPVDGGKWKHRVTYTDENGSSTYECSHLAICTGLHVQPNIPTIPGIDNVHGEVFHSAEYKFRSQLAGRNVLVLGCGETAMGTSAP